MRKLIGLAALLVSCATVDQIRLPWMQESDAAEVARDEAEEQQRIEQRLRAIEQETAPRVSRPPPPPPPLARHDAADPFAEDDAIAAVADDSSEEPVAEESVAEEPAPTHARSTKSRPAAVQAPIVERECCRYCDVGKPCGNTCIARNKTCRVGRGCAC